MMTRPSSRQWFPAVFRNSPGGGLPRRRVVFCKEVAIKCVAAVILAATLSPASALELGAPLGSPTIGQPLRIEIPLRLAPGENLPGPECIRLAPPPDAPDRQFFPAGAGISLATPGAGRLVLTSPRPVRDPLVEFRLIIGCKGEWIRDYLILTHPPSAEASRSEPPGTASTGATGVVSAAPSRDKSALVEAPFVPPTGAPALPATASRAPASMRPGDATTAGGQTRTLTLDRESTLNALARQRNPGNMEARDRYRQLMARANPGLFGQAKRVGSVVMPAGTVLNMPPDLPPPDSVRSSAAAQTVVSPATAADKAKSNKSTSAPMATDSTRPAAKDRLVIGGAADVATPIKEMAISVERLEHMLIRQSELEKQLTEQLRSLENTFAGAKTQIQTMETGLQQLAVEQRKLKGAAEAKSGAHAIGMVELLALVLVAGAGGAGLLVFSHRMQLRRLAMVESPTGEPPDAVSPDLMSVTADADEVAKIAEASVAAVPGVTSATTFDASPGVLPFAAASGTASLPWESREPATPLPATSQRPAAAPPKLVEPTFPLDRNRDANALRLSADDDHLDRALDGPSPFELPECTPEEIERNIEMERERERKRAANPLSSVERPESVEDPAVELADIMVSMGLAKEAVSTLMQFITDSKTRDLGPWLKALDIYRTTGQRDEFHQLAESMRRHLNVAPDGWQAAETSETKSLEDFPRLVKQLLGIWPSDAADQFLAGLLEDNRNGTRAGFPQSVAAEIEFLRRILRLLRSAEEGGL